MGYFIRCISRTDLWRLGSWGDISGDHEQRHPKFEQPGPCIFIDYISKWEKNFFSLPWIKDTLNWNIRSPKVASQCKIVLVQDLNMLLYSCLVPYDSTKPFVWSEYLTACGAKAVPNMVFKQVRTANTIFTMLLKQHCNNSSLLKLLNAFGIWKKCC